MSADSWLSMSSKWGLSLHTIVFDDKGARWKVTMFSGSRKAKAKPAMRAIREDGGIRYVLPDNWSELEALVPYDFWPPFITEYFKKPIHQERLF
jgi:hypothetical protein